MSGRPTTLYANFENDTVKVLEVLAAPPAKAPQNFLAAPPAKSGKPDFLPTLDERTSNSRRVHYHCVCKTCGVHFWLCKHSLPTRKACKSCKAPISFKKPEKQKAKEVTIYVTSTEIMFVSGSLRESHKSLYRDHPAFYHAWEKSGQIRYTMLDADTEKRNEACNLEYSTAAVSPKTRRAATVKDYAALASTPSPPASPELATIRSKNLKRVY